MKRYVVILLMVLHAGCVTEDFSEPISRTERELSWMQERADAFVHDREWRRAQAEAAFWKPELSYARKIMNAYALEEGGWDLLPEMDAQSAAVFAQHDAQPSPFASSDEVPATREEWLSLGEQVFWRMPMRAAPYLQWLAGRPDLWDEVGLETDSGGAARGLARFETARGREAVGATCGLCHGDEGMAGRASRDLDLGRARALFAAERGVDGDVFDRWPHGTIDVTDDGVTDPVAIPDLWSVEHNQYLNASGVIAMESPAALAVRLETQYIVGHSLETRPSRVLVWALTMYVLSLEAPAQSAAEPQSAGREVFARHCASCHVPEQAFSGGLVPADSITSDPLAAQSRYRGTGFYKIPSLVGISAGGPYLHDNSVPDLETLIRTHPYGPTLDTDEQKDLLAYLRNL